MADCVSSPVLRAGSSGSHRATAADVDLEAVNGALQQLQALVQGDAELEQQCATLGHLVDYRRQSCRLGLSVQQQGTVNVNVPPRFPGSASDSVVAPAPASGSGRGWERTQKAMKGHKRPPDPIISIQQLRKFELDALVEQGVCLPARCVPACTVRVCLHGVVGLVRWLEQGVCLPARRVPACTACACLHGVVGRVPVRCSHATALLYAPCTHAARSVATWWGMGQRLRAFSQLPLSLYSLGCNSLGPARARTCTTLRTSTAPPLCDIHSPSPHSWPQTPP